MVLPAANTVPVLIENHGSAGTSSDWTTSVLKGIYEKVDCFDEKFGRFDEKVDRCITPMCAAFIGRSLQSKAGLDSLYTKLQQQFKLDLIQTYQRPCNRLPKKWQCMVSGLLLDSEIVQAAHLVAKSAEMVCQFFAAWPPGSMSAAL